MSYAKKLFWKNWIVLLLGFLVLLLPFLGFPGRISAWLYGILGFLIVLVSFIIGRGLSYAYSAPEPDRTKERSQRAVRAKVSRVHMELVSPVTETASKPEEFLPENFLSVENSSREAQS